MVSQTCDEESEPDFVLAVVPAMRRRSPWPAPAPSPDAVPVRVSVAIVAPPPVPSSLQPAPPGLASADPAGALPGTGLASVDGPVVAPAIAVADPDPGDAAAWPDHRWWTSTVASTVVHVVVLTILALIVTVPERLARPRTLQLGQPVDDADLEELLDPQELAAVEIAPPDPVDEAVADLPAAADVDVTAAAADAAAFDAPDVADGLAAFDAAGLVARVGGGAAGGGFGGDIGRRLAASGAKTGDVQVSLSWDNFNDIDLHVVAPSGERICFSHRASRCRGLLDVDMNALGPQSREPVENVFWPAKRAPPGEYRVFVHHYWRFDPDEDDTTFTVHVLVNGRKERFMGSVKSGDPPLLVAAFRRAANAEAADEFIE